MKELFFELIRIAIGTQERLSRVPSKKEWGRLFKIAERQRLLGICFYGVKKVASPIYDNDDDIIEDEGRKTKDEGHNDRKISIPGELYDYWLGTAALIQQQNQKVNKQCVEVQEKIEEEGFRTYIMKGQGNAVLYDETRRTKDEKLDYDDDYDHDRKSDDLALLRQAGDIDIYLEGGFKNVMNFVNRTYPTNEVNELEIHYHCLKDTEVEIHYRPFIMRNPFRNRKLQQFFLSENEACFKNKVTLPKDVGSITVPTTKFNIIHQMAHIYHHLFTEGIGMRQVMDYYFVLQSRRPTPNPSLHSEGNIKGTLRELGLIKFAQALMWILQYVFHLEEKFLICKPNEKDGRFLLGEIMRAGNFGKFDDRLSRGKVSKWQSFWRVNKRNLRLLRFNHWDWFWGPLWRSYHFVWRKLHGFV